MTDKKKLIEIALPLEAINEASRKEKNPFLKHHPRALHVWWARRPLAACRAVLFASLVDDPSSHPENFPTEEAQTIERQRLFRIIEDLVRWENITKESVLSAARAEILRSCDGDPPSLLDPFCGGGSIPLEAQRLGLHAVASDLNPVSVLITKALIEIPPIFHDQPPVHPGSTGQLGSWQGASGLAEDVRFYGRWIQEEAARRIGHLYPTVRLPREYGGATVDVQAWIWARTVSSPNPAWHGAMPLVRSFTLSTKKGREASVVPVVDLGAGRVEFKVAKGVSGLGPTVNRTGATCLVTQTPVPLSYLRSEAKGGRMGTQLLALVVEGQGGRLFLSPSPEQEAAALVGPPPDAPDTELPDRALGFRVQAYGMTKHRDLFTNRQLAALCVLTDLVREARERVLQDALAFGLEDDRINLEQGGSGAVAYGDAVATYLALAVSRFVDFSNVICSWDAGNTNLRQLFSRQAVPMAWDFVETNPLNGVVPVTAAFEWAASSLEALPARASGVVAQLDAAHLELTDRFLISTDPPYYDNIGYADLADIFYVWLRRALRGVYPQLTSTLLTPKSSELVATPYRFEGNRQKAAEFFEVGLGSAFTRCRALALDGYPVTVYYAFKQAEESESSESVASTGWETMLEGLLSAGFAVLGTWPMRTEQQQRSVAAGTNALASSIVLVCRPRPTDAPLATRKEFLGALHQELPGALRRLQQGNIAPVDLAQAAVGPGIGVFSRYAKVVEADGLAMTVRTALGLVNQVLDETLSEQESDFDRDSRWALAWFEESGMNPGPFGKAEILSKAKNTSIEGMVRAGLLESKAGNVRLLERGELDDDWNPTSDAHLTVWEVTQHLVRSLEVGGESGAAKLLREVGGLGETARELAYRLYVICERKKWAKEAMAYNGLVIAWPAIARLASSAAPSASSAERLF